MGHFWRAEPGGSFDRVELPEVGLSLVPGGDGLELVEGAAAPASVRVLPFERQAVLLLAPEARALVNGEPALSVAVVEERDELLVGGESLLFGSVRLTAPRALVGEDGSQRCGRCYRMFRLGDVVIECGNCSGLHHEGVPSGEQDALLCWSHGPACGVCEHDRAGWAPGDDDDA